MISTYHMIVVMSKYPRNTSTFSALLNCFSFFLGFVDVLFALLAFFTVEATFLRILFQCGAGHSCSIAGASLSITLEGASSQSFSTSISSVCKSNSGIAGALTIDALIVELELTEIVSSSLGLS